MAIRQGGKGNRPNDNKIYFKTPCQIEINLWNGLFCLTDSAPHSHSEKYLCASLSRAKYDLIIFYFSWLYIWVIKLLLELKGGILIFLARFDSMSLWKAYENIIKIFRTGVGNPIFVKKCTMFLAEANKYLYQTYTTSFFNVKCEKHVNIKFLN